MTRHGRKWRPKAPAPRHLSNKLPARQHSEVATLASTRFVFLFSSLHIAHSPSFSIPPFPPVTIKALMSHPTKQSDVAELQTSSPFSSDESDSDSGMDPITAERKRRAKKQDHLRRSAGEPQKPIVSEIKGMREGFLAMLRMVLAE